MSSNTSKSKSSRREGDASSTRAISTRARREAVLSQRRTVAESSDEGEREKGNVRPADDPVPSTSGLRIRENIALKVPVKMMDGRPESTDREPEREELPIIEDDRVLTSDTEVECVEREEECDRKTADQSSDTDMAPLPEKVRKRERPPTDPDHEGQFTADVLAEKARLKREKEWEREQIKALDPATEVRRGPRLKKAQREEQELLLEFRETSAAGLTAIVNEQVARLRKMAQGCSNLKGIMVKALWDTSISIAAATAALNLRSHASGNAVAAPEWDDMREELRQLRADMAHLRVSNDTLKEDLRRERVEREKLENALEKERGDRSRGREEESLILPSSDPERITLRPRAPRRAMIESEDEEVEAAMEVEEIRPPSPPVPVCRPQLGEIIPPAYRPPVRGVVALIEPEKPFEGARPPPDAATPATREADEARPLTIGDLNQALELMLPRLLGRMGLSNKTAEETASAPLPRPDPGSAHVKGHTSTGGGGEGRQKDTRPPTAGGGASGDPPQPPASSGANGPQKRKKRGGRGGAQIPPETPGPRPPLSPRRPLFPPRLLRSPPGPGRRGPR